MAIEPQSTNQYVDEPTLLRFPLNETSLKIIQINIRGLNDFDKLDSLCIFLRNLYLCHSTTQQQHTRPRDQQRIGCPKDNQLHDGV